MEDLFSNVAVFAAGELRPPFQHSHTASESTHCLSQFESDEASAEHDQVLRYAIQFQGFDVGQRSGGFEARHIWNGCPCPNVQEYLIAGNNAHGPVLRFHLDRPWGHEARLTKDQFCATGFVTVEVKIDETIDHLALARAHPCHIDHDGSRCNSKLRRTSRQLCNLGAVNDVL